MAEDRDQGSEQGRLSSDTCPLRSGFTLVEMAIVLIVMGLIMLTVLPALTALRTGSQRSATQTNLQALMTATAAFVQANGCLPCPTPATTIGSGFGHVRGDGSASPVSCNGCAAPEGIPPFASLGLPLATARDGWGHWITMRVDPALTVLPSNPANCAATNSCSNFVPPQAPCLASPDVGNNICLATQVGFSDKGLCRSGIVATSRINVANSGGGTQQAAVIFVSHGANGYGSYIADSAGANGCRLQFPSAPEACLQALNCSSLTGLGAAECNASNTTQFVNASTVVSSTNPYDDVAVYADRNTLVSMLGNGSCQTVW